MAENIKMPLEGIKVVELATVVAAPTAGRMLSAYGAEVIKVESLTGDDYRVAGNFECVVCEDYKNPLFTIQNSGKKLVSIDLKQPDGKKAMLRLLDGADVFLTNVRTGGLQRLGLDYESLHERFPRLVYAHFSGFGPKGPVASNPGFDSTAFWLRSGPMADWQVPGSFPFNPTYAFGDMATSSVLFSGILMALIGRECTGHGTRVDTSLFASGIWCNAVAVVSHQPQFGGKRPLDPLRPADPFSQFYMCSDGKWIGIFDNEYQRDLPKFAKLFGMPDLVENPEYASLSALAESDAIVEFVQRLNELFLTRSSGEWREYLSSNNVSCEVMHCIRDVSTDEQALANGYVKELKFKDGLSVMMPRPPVHFSDYEQRDYVPTGRIGEDTDRVFMAMGYTEEEISQLRDKKTIL
mgnify:FL=1|jgi:crotonobetainyl-CoA:carnitine CoA-transferase CaiB-like acyl-CoA transferase